MTLPRNREDLEAMIKNSEQESLNLEYKRSASIGNDSGKRKEIAKDVSSFANADGGMIIYGIVENNHLPERLDEGVEHAKYNREWLENVITSNIAPKIEGLEISQIPLTDTHSAFAVEIPKSFRDAHQERNERRYYKRYNFKAQSMEDYEIQDIRNRKRVVAPLVNFDVEFRKGFVRLVLSNTGEIGAHDVKLSFSESLPWLEQATPSRILESGVKFLPPGRRIILPYGGSSSLLSATNKKPLIFDVTVSYFHPILDHRLSDTFYIDLLDFRDTIRETSDIEELTQKVTESLSTLGKELKNIADVTKAIALIASPTGLNLSVTTIENLRHVFNQDEEIEKINPLYCNPNVFSEVLELDQETAWRLNDYFGGHSEAESIQEIPGVSAETLKLFERHFVKVEVPKYVPRHEPQDTKLIPPPPLSET